jgi:S-adenosylmethionine decarboxylase
MVLGRELIADVEDLEKFCVLETINGVKPLMEKIIKGCNLNVVSQCEYQFSPIGATMLYLLSESHLTIHTYPEKKACSINLYTCDPNTDFLEALNITYNYFNQPWMIKKIIDR